MWCKFTCIFILFVLSCGRSGPKYKIRRKNNQIAYLVDESAVSLSENIEKSINDTFYDPMPDAVFDLDGYTPMQFQTDAGYPYVVILSCPQLASYAFFKMAFGNKDTGFYTKRNVFSQGDFVVGVNAPGPELLGAFLAKYSDSVKSAIYADYMKRLKKLVYFAGKNSWMQKELIKKYGIFLDLPDGWTFIKLKDTIFKFDNAFGIVKHYPERFMCFYNNPAIPYVDKDLLVFIRDSLASLYYGGDKIVKSTVREDSILFEGKYPAIVLTGAWENNKDFVGGPFRIIAFKSERGFFMIDMGAYAPQKRRKIQYLLRMQILAESIKFLK